MQFVNLPTIRNLIADENFQDYRCMIVSNQTQAHFFSNGACAVWPKLTYSTLFCWLPKEGLTPLFYISIKCTPYLSDMYQYVHTTGLLRTAYRLSQSTIMADQIDQQSNRNLREYWHNRVNCVNGALREQEKKTPWPAWNHQLVQTNKERQQTTSTKTMSRNRGKVSARGRPVFRCSGTTDGYHRERRGKRTRK